MHRPASRLALFILVLSAGVSFAQSKGWKIEKLASLGRVSTSGFIPTRLVAVNDVGQIAFVKPDGVYVREPSGVITKRMSEVGAPLTIGSSGIFDTVRRTSVGIDNNGVVYAGHNRDVFRQAPGGPTEIVFSTSRNNFILDPNLSADVLVTGNGNVFAATSALLSSNSKSQVLKWNGTSFQPVFESADVNELIFLSDATDDSLVFQSFVQGSPNIARFGRIDGLNHTDLASLQILDIISTLSPGISIALGSRDTMAYVQKIPSNPLRITKTVGSTTSSFELDGITTEDKLTNVTCACILSESEFGSISVNGSGQVAYAADGFTAGYRGIFGGPDPAIDTILPLINVDGGQPRRVDRSTVHDVTDSGEVILSYINDLGESYLARAIPLRSVVDLVNQSFIDGLNGWQTTGLVVRPIGVDFGNSALAITPGSSISQEIDLPNIPFQIEVFIPLIGSFQSNLEVSLGDRVLPPEAFSTGNIIRRFVVNDPSLFGQSDVTFRISTTNSPAFVDGIRITAIPEVPSVVMIAAVLALGLFRSKVCFETRRH